MTVLLVCKFFFVGFVFFEEADAEETICVLVHICSGICSKVAYIVKKASRVCFFLFTSG